MPVNVMQKKYTVINGLTVVCALFIVGCTSPNIMVKEKAQVSLQNYRAAYITSHSDDWKIKRVHLEGRGDGYLNDKIGTALKTNGLLEAVDEMNADLRVECHFRTGWCLPHVGRHFDVFFSSIHTVNIRLLDMTTKDVVGEVEYQRPRFATRPPDDFVDVMISEMISEKDRKNHACK